MIRVGKYGIEAGDKYYTVGKITKQTVKKKGKEGEYLAETEYLAAPSYYGSVSIALNAIRQRMQLETLKPFDGTLEDAVEAIRKADERFEKLIAGIKF